jgi:hypothetical protein
MTIILPNDVIENILSYGDPIVNKKYTFVVIQIKYLKNEFDYHRTLKPYCIIISSIWYRYPPEWFKKYALYKNNHKISINSESNSCHN